MKKILLAFAAMATIGVSACASTSGPGFDSRPGATTAWVQNPDFNNGVIPPEAYAAGQRYEASCYDQLRPQLRGPVRSGVAGAVDYGVAGAVGGATGLSGGAAAGFRGVDPGAYAAYGGIAGAAQGVTGGYVNGVIQGSTSLANARGECVNDFWSDGANERFPGTHPVTVTFGTTGAPPPALAGQRPK